MKKSIFIILYGIYFLAACQPSSKQAQLAKLEKEREALTEKIEKLKAELSGNETISNNNQIPHVRIKKIESSDFRHFIQVQGTVESDNNIMVSSRASGLIKNIYVKSGDRISKGQLLADIDGAIIESNLAELDHALGLANTIYERQKRLWDKKIGSEIEFLQAKNNKESLEKKMLTLQEQYKLTKITAPITGTIDAVLIKEGEMTAAGMPAVRVVQLSRLKITASLSETYISNIQSNNQVQVEIPVLNRKFNQKIDSVSQIIDPQSRTFRVEIPVPKEQKDLKPNMLAVVTINDYFNPEALSIPQNIIQATGTSQFLFTAEEKNGKWTANKRYIVTGKDFDNQIEVKEGLAPGEFVVIFGYQNLADGQIVAIDNPE
ncbi:MAG: efflux RND transporter periplasmic adaptor subunit [Candidatus Aminicenantes bacterium]|nr:efflux RND transporter periplasmic adaptor subunit [Candidatus Aminicenantes bacterium]